MLEASNNWSKGVEKIIELNLSSEEKNNFKKIYNSVRDLFNAASARSSLN